MLPTLKPGQDVLSFNWAYFGNKPKVGDIVIIKLARKEIVKRIQKVDGRRVFVIGDNQKSSTDSRHFGKVNINQIVGKVVYPSKIDCPNRKDAICHNCGFKITCCGEP